MKGIKLLVETNFRSQAMTMYPTINAITVATAVSASENTLEVSDDESAP